MLYLISDIHGNLRDFQRMMKKIAFNHERDTLIIVGDIFDRGPDGIKILEFIRPYLLEQSMKLLMGNHELFAVMYLKGTLDERRWCAFGGVGTVEDIKQMTFDEREELLRFLEKLPYYMEINSEYLGDVIVTHTGIDCDNYVYNPDGTINIKKSIEKAAQTNVFQYMIGMDIHQVPGSDRQKYDQYLIVGHVPCYRLNEDLSNRFYRNQYYMDIDAGAGHKDQGGTLGCYCVTTNEEFYL